MLGQIVVKLLDLVKLQTLANEGGYAGSFTLSDESAIVALSSALWLDNLDIWQGANDFLTEDEIDEIKELTANLQYELMTHVSTGGNMQKIGSASINTDTATVYIDDIDEGEWIAFKLIIQGMLSNYTENYPDHVELEINDIQQNNAYSSYGRFFYKDNQISYESILNYPYNFLYWAAAAGEADVGIWGNAELRFHNPLDTGHKAFSYEAVTAGYAANRLNRCAGVGGIFIASAIDKILIRPYYGTSWLAGGSEEPDELTMTLYGLS